MPFRFVHTADIHLDSPLRSLALRDPDLAELIGDATRQALGAVVDLCLHERVDALLIAGDLYDGDQTSMKTARFLAAQLGRLHAAGIPVFKIRGNHDALSRITRQLVFPDSVTVFDGRGGQVSLERGGLEIVVHGLSFAQPQAPESLLPKYRRPIADAVNIGLMHTSLDGSPGHDVYAPCTLAALSGHGFEYWALGHIHLRAEHGGARPVVMPGMPQGRDINESGPKTVSLVTVGDDRSIKIEQRPTSIAQFERVRVDLRAAREWREAVMALAAALGEARGAAASEHLVARIELVAGEGLGWRLRRDRDLLLAEAQAAGAEIGKTWIEKLEIAAAPRRARAAASGDPVEELGDLMREQVLASHGFREEAHVLVRELLADLPPESRGFGGGTEAEFEAFLDRITAEGSEEILARLASESGAG